MLNTFYEESCFTGLKNIPDNYIDLIFADLPYNITNNSYDKSPFPINELWKELTRIAKPNTPFIFTSKEPFTSHLILSNLNYFKYKLIWRKNLKTNFLNAKKQPMSAYEEIVVFYKNQPTYNPQLIPRTFQNPAGNKKNTKTTNYNKLKEDYLNNPKDWLYPDDVIDEEDYFSLDAIDLEDQMLYIKCQHNSNKIHPNQKPIELLKYIINTFSNESDIILDPTAGSGSTGIAAKLLNRNYILFDPGKNKDNLSYKSLFDNYIKNV
jgi:site-specific DNA-methyltransferase (adenine-specific)